MNEKKQGGFKLSYLIIFLVVVLLFCLLFIDFGNNGQLITTDRAFEIIENSDDKDVAENSEKAQYVYIRNGVGYILTVGSKYNVNQVPDYSDYYFDYQILTMIISHGIVGILMFRPTPGSPLFVT